MRDSAAPGAARGDSRAVPPTPAGAAPRRRRLLLADRRFLVLLALGFSAGVPLPLVAGVVLRQWFTEAGLSLTEIGLTALIAWSYSFKFLWSPLLDEVRPPPGLLRFGRRRGWLLLIQPCLAAAILATGLTDPAAAPLATAACAVVVAFLSASQDIVVDAYRIEILEEREQGYGLACYIWGYRAALLASGAGTLLLVGAIGWAGAFAYAAALIGVGVLAVLAGREPAAPSGGEATRGTAGWRARLRAAVVEPFADFVRRPSWLAILLFVGLFKLGEAMAGTMTIPFYRQLGFSREEVATVGSVFGLVALLGGALAGGWVVARIGVGRALVLTGLGQMLSNLMYVALAHAGHDVAMLWAQVGIENFTDGMADAAFVAYLSGLTNRAFTATQYALLSSLATIPLRTAGAASGWLVERLGLGWADFFLITTAAALPAMAIMLWLLARLPPPAAARAPAAAAAPADEAIRPT
ncbi:integral membrane signal transducer protein [Caldovatus sediminis]|uniref:Integral membrane signal transducer protein n=1 Tax=Caldovatus sediminis TaxID=2041189 RepID=A0A8J2ZEJ1_9PROT|nr:MFS transporter [Caldovatus sediminis]GGG45655.1 integral membrane signal transducer protein [Caldovatus sediminis]